MTKNSHCKHTLYILYDCTTTAVTVDTNYNYLTCCVSVIVWFSVLSNILKLVQRKALYQYFPNMYITCNTSGLKYVLWLTLCVTEYWFVLAMRPLSDLIVVGTICRIIWKIYFSDIQFTRRSICYSRFINYTQETNLNVILVHLQIWEENNNKLCQWQWEHS